MLIILFLLTVLCFYFSKELGGDVFKIVLCALYTVTGIYVYVRFIIFDKKFKRLSSELYGFEKFINTKVNKMADNVIQILEVYEFDKNITSDQQGEGIKYTSPEKPQSTPQSSPRSSISTKVNEDQKTQPQHEITHKANAGDSTPESTLTTKQSDVIYSIENGLTKYTISRVLKYTANDIFGYKMTALHYENIILNHDEVCDQAIGTPVYIDAMIKAIRFVQARGKNEKFIIFVDIPYWAITHHDSALYSTIEFEEFDSDSLVLNIVNIHNGRPGIVNNYIERARKAGIRVSIDVSNINTIHYITHDSIVTDYMMIKYNILSLNDKYVSYFMTYLKNKSIQSIVTSIKTEHEKGVTVRSGIEIIEGQITGRTLQIRV